MKRIFSLVIVAVAAISLSSCAATGEKATSSAATGAAATATPTEDVEQTLAKMERDWADAIVKGDLAFTDRILADDWSMINWDGRTQTKAQLLTDWKAGGYKAQSMNLEPVKVRVFGDTAVASYGQTEKSQSKGKDSSGHYFYTDVWVKRNGKWQVAASHGCKADVPKG